MIDLFRNADTDFGNVDILHVDDVFGVPLSKKIFILTTGYWAVVALSIEFFACCSRCRVSRNIFTELCT